MHDESLAQKSNSPGQNLKKGENGNANHKPISGSLLTYSYSDSIEKLLEEQAAYYLNSS